jgi:trans-2,3-dihydro-3-hydroxyanthranilate isomerase
MPSLRCIHVDVFTDTPLCGNPLAVVLDGQGLTGGQMQAIAREMNLSETTFVLPSTAADADVRVRIFTPRLELPFAGHPVVGTAYVLVTEGLLPPRGEQFDIRLELGAGVLPVDVVCAGGKVTRVMMTQQSPRFLTVLPLDDVGLLARGLGIDVRDIQATGLPAQLVSTGLPQLMVPVQSLQVLRSVKLELSLLQTLCERYDTHSVYAFSRETVTASAHVHTRLFAPLAGVPEDPATGSAGGALGAYLVHHRVFGGEQDVIHLENEQGYELGRPSRIFIEVERRGAEISRVRVGGSVVKVMDGTLYV